MCLCVCTWVRIRGCVCACIHGRVRVCACRYTIAVSQLEALRQIRFSVRVLSNSPFRLTDVPRVRPHATHSQAHTQALRVDAL
jgi:tRNA(Arg) A34 adenosine deaminase TadA